MTIPTYSLQTRARYDRGMRRQQSQAWYSAMAVRLDMAAHTFGLAGNHAVECALLDRADECRAMARAARS